MEWSRPVVRRLLEALLPSDSQLDAFCLDYFPHVFRRFSAGMDRIRKHNLLLEQVEPWQIAEALQLTDAAGFQRILSSLPVSTPPPLEARPAPLPSAEASVPPVAFVQEQPSTRNVVTSPALRPQPGLPLTAAFRTAGQPEHTFVEPAQSTELNLRLRTPWEGLLVEGPSGVGKTTAVQSALRQLEQTHRSAWVLHLSDMHFGASEAEASWYDQLAADLKYELKLSKLDAVIVSGDISNRAEPEEYQSAQRFYQQLMSEFGLSPQKVVLVPGNHDVSWSLSEQAYTPVRRRSYKGALVPGLYIDGGDYIELRAEQDYKRRFEPFADFHQAVRLEPYSLEYGEQATLHHFPEQNLLVLGLNSAWALDHHYKARVEIHPTALSRALQQIRNTPAYAPCLKLAVWHHSWNGPGEDRLKDLGFLEQLAQAGFRLGLHGHIHKADNQFFRYRHQARGGGIELICAGTFGAPTREWVPGYPLQYQLLQFSDKRLTVHTRRREELNGSWKPDARWLAGPGKDPLPRYTLELSDGEDVTP